MQREATFEELSALEKRARAVTVGNLEQVSWADERLGRIYVALGRSKHPDVRHGGYLWAGYYGTFVGEQWVMRSVNWEYAHLTADQAAANVMNDALYTCGLLHERSAYDEGWWRSGRA